MRPHFLRTVSLLILSISSIITLAQKAEWVEQVIVGNGNKFEFTPPYGDYVTLQTYNPSNGNTIEFDQIMTQSVQDIAIANGKIYVAAQDSIVMYDANTLQRLYAVADSGLSRLHVFNNRLIVAKQFPIVRFFVEVLSADDLSLIARIQNISGDCKAILSTKDSIYVAVPGNYLSTEGKLAVIDYNTWTLQREINFGPNAVGITELYNYGGVIFTVNETPFGVSNVGSVTAYDTYNLTHTNYVINMTVGNGSGGLKNSGMVGNLLYLTLNNGIGSFNLDTRLLEDASIFPDPGSANHIYYTSYDADYVNNRIYANVGNRINWGINLVGSTTGDSITSFTTGFNTDAIALDYRVPVSMEETPSGELTIALFPNPVVDYLRIRPTGNMEVDELIIRDITGKTMWRTSNSDIKGSLVDCSSFPAGLYLVSALTKDGVYSARFIKQ